MKMKKPEIGVMGQLTTKNILDDLDFVIKNDFQWFEIGLDWVQNFNLSDKTINEIKKRAEESNVKLIIHTAWYLPTSSLLPEIKKGVIKNIKKAIVLADKVGSDRLTIHPGYREMPDPALELTYSSLIDNLNKIVKNTKKYKVNICLENLDNMASYLCYNVKDYLRVLRAVRGLKTTLDIGHANTTETKPVEYLDNVKETILNMHVHDNNGKNDEHKCIGEGNIDFIKLFKKCKEIDYYGPFILELFPYGNILRGKEEFLKIWNNVT